MKLGIGKKLRGVAEILNTAVRQSDTVARYGGEEFVYPIIANPYNNVR